MALRIFGAVKSYLGGVLIAIDQFANAVLLGGFADETISSRLGRRIKRYRGKDPLSNATCAALDVLDPDHCGSSIEETPTGETDPHHLGRVIREQPRTPEEEAARKRHDPLVKLRKAGFAAVLALSLMGCGKLAESIVRNALGDCRPDKCPAGQRCVPDGDGTVHRCIPDAPPPEPSPSAGTDPVPSPQPSPHVSPSLPPPASPSPPSGTPCVSVSPVPCEKPDGCVSCAAYMADAIRSGELIREGRLVYNIGNRGKEYFDPQTCDTVWPDGSLRNKRLHKDGTICPACPPQPSPSPCVTPKPPTPPPSPPPSGECVAPPLTASGNFPLPPPGECPCYFKALPFSMHIKVNQRPCVAEEGQTCVRTTASATQRVGKPGLEHTCLDEDGSYALGNCKAVGEMLRACQEPQFIDYQERFPGDPNPGGGIMLQIAHPDWHNAWGRLDKQTCDPRHNACPPGMVNPVHNFNGHDRAVDRGGRTLARACMPDGTKCSTTEYETGR